MCCTSVLLRTDRPFITEQLKGASSVLLRAELTGPPDQRAAQLGREFHRNLTRSIPGREPMRSSGSTRLPFANKSRSFHLRRSTSSSGPIELVVTFSAKGLDSTVDVDKNQLHFI